jgi:hypothetical protein
MLKEVNFEFQDQFDVEATIQHFTNEALVLSEYFTPTSDLLLNDIIKFNYSRLMKNLSLFI